MEADDRARGRLTFGVFELDLRAGELRKRGEIWWIRYYRNGKRYEESSHTDKKEVARNLLCRREGAIAGPSDAPALFRIR